MEEEYVDYTRLLEVINELEKRKTQERMGKSTKIRKNQVVIEISKNLYQTVVEKVESKVKENILRKKEEVINKVVKENLSLIK